MNIRNTVVTAPAASKRLSNLLSVLAAMGKTDAMMEEKIYLNTQIDEVSGDFAKYCNRTFQVETLTDTFFLDGSEEQLSLSRCPVTAITSITETFYAAGNPTVLTAADYVLDADAGLLNRLWCGFPTRWCLPQTIVVYSAGLATIPPNLQGALHRAVKARFMARGRDPLLRSETVENVQSYDYWVTTGNVGNSQFMQDIVDVLDSYRLTSVG